jgi:hypothetical protein
MLQARQPIPKIYIPVQKPTARFASNQVAADKLLKNLISMV